MRRVYSLWIVLFAPLLAHAADPGIQFFEAKIRPVLVKQCYSCHSADSKKLKGGLRVDTREGLRKGGETGPAVVPGKLTESLLMSALRHDSLAMPPSEKLPDEVIADFEKWIKMGAPDPRDGKAAVSGPGINIEEGKKFWAFQPIKKPTSPNVKTNDWARGDLDKFILAGLEAKGLKPTTDADRVTLIRRATIALIGLPPTPQEIDDFVKDSASDAEAFAKVIDRLLASDHYGERWGRHWLDLARYADSNGKDENLTFHESFRYRDYVIQSFNRDKSYDRFIVEQLAGDLMPGDNQAQRDEQLTGTGFLVVGPKVLADRDFAKRRMDVIDEQIETVGRAFLALTLGCARCHDHKFDPLPTNDYYALAGIFNSTRTLDGIKLGNAVVSGWSVRPLGGPESTKLVEAMKKHQQEVKALDDKIKKAKTDLKSQEDRATMRSPASLAGVTVDDKQAKFTGMWKASMFSRPYVGEGYVHDDKMNKGEKSAVFTPTLSKAGEYEVLISYTASKGRSTNTPVTVVYDGGEKTVLLNQEETPKIDGLFRSVGKFKFEAGTKGSVTISTKGTEGYVIVDAVRFIPQNVKLDEKEMAMGVPTELRKEIATAQEQLKKMESDLEALKKTAPPMPTMVMAVQDEAKIVNCQVNIRGNPHTLGAEVPRGFVSVASTGKQPTLPKDKSGRLELAQWIASKDNPLTARVMANRIWYHLMGEGIVRTLDNFGIQGERPSHPELLDALATLLIENGWSIKKTIRAVMLSRTYALAVTGSPELLKGDPENRLFGRTTRRRVEAEVIRDTMLHVSGQLDRTMGGNAVPGLGERAIDNDSKGGVANETSKRRSVYLAIIRNDLPQLLEVFDFADPEVCTGKRDATTVATQALYLMNSPFVQEQAKATAKKLAEQSGEDAAKLTDLYRRALGRKPTADEVKTVLGYLAARRQQTGKGKANEIEIQAWTGVCQALFGCTEFRFVE